MRITKREHACLVVESDGGTLVLDPGSFSTLGTLHEVSVVVVTHAHGDHLSTENLRTLRGMNPHLRVLGTAEVARAAEGLDVQVVTPGEEVAAGPFALRFTGGRHAVVHHSLPRADNVGVLVDGGRLYHPGDSFAPPGADVDVLAVPVSGPWLKIGEVMDFVAAVAPRRAVPIHEVMNSAVGQRMALARVADALGERGALTALEVGESIEV